MMKTKKIDFVVRVEVPEGYHYSATQLEQDLRREIRLVMIHEFQPQGAYDSVDVSAVQTTFVDKGVRDHIAGVLEGRNIK